MSAIGLENERQRAALQLLNVEYIPGTQVMKDVGEVHFVHAGTGGHGTVLVPTPTDHIADPLNWSRFRKVASVAILATYTSVSAASVLSMAPLFPIFAEKWDLKDNQLTMITGSTVIVLGFGNFIVIPLSNIFGRRFAVLLFGVLLLICTIWQALAQSYGSFLGARCLVGLAASPSETIVVQVVADLFFLHERGTWVGFSMLSAFLGTYVGPVIAGAMSEHHGWRSFFWLSLGLICITMLLVLAGFPETGYRRQAAIALSSPADASEQGQGDKASEVHVGTVASTNPADPVLGRGHPVKQQYLPIQKPHLLWKKFLVQDFLSVFRIGFYPIILWSSLCLAGSACLNLYFNLTESFILGERKYHLTPDQVGYTNLTFLVGSILGVLTAGPFSDWVIRRSTRKNGGVREAEMRLPALIPFATLLTLGVSLSAAGIKYNWPWEILVVFGYGGAGLGVTSVPTIGIAYAVDCYKPIAGELMVVATVMKNTAGFGMSYWVPSLGDKYGWMTPLMVWYTFTALPWLLAIPLWVWGKKLRRLTKDSVVHSYDQY